MIKTKEGRWGKISYLDNDLLGKHIDVYGEFSRDECNFLFQLASEHKGLVLDVGAHIGCMTQVFVRAGCTVEAFEPQPYIYDLLQKNTKTAGKYVNTHRMALSYNSRTVEMPLIDYEAVDINTAAASICEGGKGLEVHTDTIDSFKFENVSIIKVDAEGSEQEVLDGAIETIGRSHPIIYLEGDRFDKLPDLAKFMDSMGYNYTRRDFNYFSEDNFEKAEKDLEMGGPDITYNWECRFVNDK